MDKLKQTHPFIQASGALFLAVVAFVSGVSAVSLLSRTNGILPASAAVATAFPAPMTLDPGALLAKAAVVYDPATNTILFAKNSQMPLPLASLTKLITASAVLEREAPSSVIDITPQDIAPEGDWGFAPGDKVLLSDLLRIGLIASSNDAMQAAADSLGPDYLDKMQSTVQSLGLTDMRFNNPTGLDESPSTAGAYGSAYDMARLASFFSHTYPQYFGLTTTQSTVSIQDGSRTLTAQATAVPLANLPGLVGAKTGYTDLAGGNLVVVFNIEVGHPLVAVVLGSTEEGRFSDMMTIINAIRVQNTQTQ